MNQKASSPEVRQPATNLRPPTFSKFVSAQIPPTVTGFVWRVGDRPLRLRPRRLLPERHHRRVRRHNARAPTHRRRRRRGRSVQSQRDGGGRRELLRRLLPRPLHGGAAVRGPRRAVSGGVLSHGKRRCCCRRGLHRGGTYGIGDDAKGELVKSCTFVCSSSPYLAFSGHRIFTCYTSMLFGPGRGLRILVPSRQRTSSRLSLFVRLFLSRGHNICKGTMALDKSIRSPCLDNIHSR